MTIPAAAKDAGLDAATSMVLYRLDVTFTLKATAVEISFKDKKVNDCRLDSLWQNTTAASASLEAQQVTEAHLQINPLSDDRHLARESLSRNLNASHIKNEEFSV